MPNSYANLTKDWATESHLPKRWVHTAVFHPRTIRIPQRHTLPAIIQHWKIECTRRSFPSLKNKHAALSISAKTVKMACLINRRYFNFWRFSACTKRWGTSKPDLTTTSVFKHTSIAKFNQSVHRQSTQMFFYATAYSICMQPMLQ